MASDPLERARRGDERAFRELTDPYRAELRLHCYRMLGSLADAEDQLQETLIAAWRGLGGFEGRSSVRTWLYRIATNRCLNARRDAGRRRPAAPAPPPGLDPPAPNGRDDVPWLQPYPDTLLAGLPDTAPGPAARYQHAEAVELAFIAALQRIPPRQAAVVILRDVLGYSTDETATLVTASPTAVKGALQRGRAALARRRAHRHDPAPGPDRDLARRFAAAFTGGDLDGLLALLTDDAWLTMPPARHLYLGRAATSGFLRALLRWHARRRVHLVPVRANGQPALAHYLSYPDDPVLHPAGLIVLTSAPDGIAGITHFLDRDRRLPHHFGLPAAPGTAVPAVPEP